MMIQKRMMKKEAHMCKDCKEKKTMCEDCKEKEQDYFFNKLSITLGSASVEVSPKSSVQFWSIFFAAEIITSILFVRFRFLYKYFFSMKERTLQDSRNLSVHFIISQRDKPLSRSFTSSHSSYVHEKGGTYRIRQMQANK